MKKFLALVAIASLAACNNANETETAEDGVAVDAPEATVASEDAAAAGTYEMTSADGVVTTQQVNPDGTYTEMVDGQQTESGTWRTQGEAMCFDPEGADPEECYTGSEVSADGTFRSIGPDGQETGDTVRRIS